MMRGKRGNVMSLIKWTDQEGRGGIEMTKVTERIQGTEKEIEQIENEGGLRAHLEGLRKPLL